MENCESLCREHAERLARLETLPDKIDTMDAKLDGIRDFVISIRTERNIIVAVIGFVTGIGGIAIGKLLGF